MQIQKHDIKNKILNSAKDELFEKGFKNTSMRTIAQKAGVSPSNIYNYFTDKDALLEEVLKPLMIYFDYIMREHNKPKNISIDVLSSESYKKLHINIYIKLIKKYRKELKLLLLHSYGSKYENFREEFTEKQMKIGKSFLNSLKNNHPQLNISISDFFIHTFSAWCLSILGEIVFHDISDIETENIFNNYFTFSIAGWNELLKK